MNSEPLKKVFFAAPSSRFRARKASRVAFMHSQRSTSMRDVVFSGLGGVAGPSDQGRRSFYEIFYLFTRGCRSRKPQRLCCVLAVCLRVDLYLTFLRFSVPTAQLV